MSSKWRVNGTRDRRPANFPCAHCLRKPEIDRTIRGRSLICDHWSLQLFLDHVQPGSSSAAQPMSDPDRQQENQNEDDDRGHPRILHEPQCQP